MLTRRMESRVFYCQGAEAHVWSDPDDAIKCCNGYERAVEIARDACGNVHLSYYWRPTSPTKDSSIVGIAGGVTPPASDLPASPVDAPTSPLTDDASPSITGSLRHIAFFQALGESETGTPEWEATSAGLVVLRLVDRWVWRHVRERAPTFREFVTVRRAVARVAPGALRVSLEDLASAV